MEVQRTLDGRRVLLVLAPDGFADAELAEVRRALEARGALVEVASTAPTARGESGNEVAVDVTVAAADPGRYSAVAVLGGRGTPAHLWESGPLHALLRLARAGGAAVGGLALGAPVLARAGLLEGVHATAFGGLLRAKFELTRAGAFYLEGDVVSDRRIVTGAGARDAGPFGEALASVAAAPAA